MPLWIASALAFVVLVPSCIKPERESDFFGAEGSTVTGDDEEDDDQDDDERPDARASRGDEEDAGARDKDEDDDPAADEDDDEMPSQPANPVDSGVAATRDAARPGLADASRAPASPSDAGATAAPDTSVPTEPGGGAPASKMTFSVTTVTARGRYSPRHVLAIWVTDAQGKFVKTLAKHAGIRGRWLTGWNAAASGNVVDAVTSATLNSHGARTLTWNLTNAQKMPVPDGEYKIMMEFTEADRTGVSHSVSFTKGPAGLRMMPPGAANFTNLSVALE